MAVCCWFFVSVYLFVYFETVKVRQAQRQLSFGRVPVLSTGKRNGNTRDFSSMETLIE